MRTEAPSTSGEAFEVLPAAIPGQQTWYGCDFPLVLECRAAGGGLAAALEWLRADRDGLLERATEHGAVLFRGFPLRTFDDFDAFVGSEGVGLRGEVQAGQGDAPNEFRLKS